MPIDFPTPGSSGNRIKLSKSGYVKAGLALLAILLMIFGYVLEFRHFSNTFNIGKLILIAVIFAVLLGLALGYLLRHSAEDLVETIEIYVFTTVLCIVIMPLLFHLANRKLSSSEAKIEQVEFIESNAHISDRFGVINNEEIKNSGYITYFVFEEELHKIKMRKHHFRNAKKGDQLSLPIKTGLMGFRFVDLE